jgi:erythromycin esterase-like protein
MVHPLKGFLVLTCAMLGCSARMSADDGAEAGRARPELPPSGRPTCLDAPGGCTADRGVYELAGYDPALASGDLAPVAAAVASADIVGLGEAAHASAGFIGFKIRLSRELVERHGFRAVMWETPRVPARKLDAYVQTCAGDPADAVEKGLDPIWADTLTRDFARWLCEWNRTHPDDRVQVHGFDVQDPEADRAELEQFFAAAAPGDARSWMAPLAACERQDYDACKGGLATVKARLRDREAELAARSGPSALATARIALTSYEAWQHESMISDYAKSFEARDIGMAKVVQQLRDLHFPGKKAIVWAHNIHVVKNHETVQESWVGGPIVTQGTQLDRDLGPGRYRTLALVGLDVWLDRPGQRGQVVPTPSKASLEERLHELGKRALFVDFRHPGVSQVVPPGRAFELSAPGVEVHAPAANYDGLVYLEHSPMAERLAR